jgi:hypothetical protein
MRQKGLHNIIWKLLLMQNYRIRFRAGLPIHLLYTLYKKSFPKTSG